MGLKLPAIYIGHVEAESETYRFTPITLLVGWLVTLISTNLPVPNALGLIIKVFGR